jgi:uncharacterized membrane-anchored protein
MSLGLGYLYSTAIFGLLFVILVSIQIRADKFQPFLYWFTIIATTTVGTTLADFADRSLNIGYAGGSLVLLLLLTVSLSYWKKSLGTISVSSLNSRRAEFHYWTTIMLSQTLGTALGDWTADAQGLGYMGGMVIFGSLLAILVFLFLLTKTPRTGLFWAAFILTRPFGAVVGDFLDKPIDAGGLALSRYLASVLLLFVMAALIKVGPQRSAQTDH